MNDIENFIENLNYTTNNLDKKKIEKLVDCINKIKKSDGRLFFLGVGGSAGNASHAVNDFRKICEIESYSISENVSELTARINDEGWNVSYKNILKVSKLCKKDALMIFSVGGGNIKKKVSTNIVEAIKYGKSKKCKIFGITGPKGGYTQENADVSIQINVKDNKLITPISEAFQAVIWHLIVSHKKLKRNETMWESLKK